MGRTQIYLSEVELDLLDRAARATGASRSELIRRAIREKYEPKDLGTKEERLQSLLETAGAWRDRHFTGEEYVRAIRRGDMNANLRRLGVE